MTGSARRIVALVSVALAAFALAGAAVTGYAADTLFDSQEFSERASAALDDEAVKSEVGRRVADEVIGADPDLVAFRPVIEEVGAGIVGTGAFQVAFQTAVADLHSAFFEKNENSVTLTLADLGVVLRGALEALAPKVAKEVQAKADIDLTEISPPAWIADLVQVAEDVRALELILLAVGIALAAFGLWLSADRRTAALWLGVGIAIAGVLGATALNVGETIVLAKIDESGVRDAARAIWGAFLGDLRTGLYLFALCGAVVAAAASSLLRPVDIFAPLREALEWIGRVPERIALRVLRALALLAIGALIVIRHELALEIAATLVGVYVAYAGVAELMRLTIAPPTQHERDAARTRGRRALLVTALAAGVIALAGALYVVGGGTDEDSLEVETVGCNGSRELCDRPLDQVVFPGTHNAMSAVTNKDWLFGQQDAGFPEQLRDGIRALFIDAHYGEPTKSGVVKTDLSDLTEGEAATYEEALGEDALSAALRLRDRVVDSPATGPRQVYLCHRFCELGAVPILDAFRQYRDFLAANSDEVLVVVIEDYVEPGDIEAAVEESGLIDYIHRDPLDPAPTLQRMIDSGGRVVMMAEHDAGGRAIPWYRPAYKALVQETPYSFKQTAELTDPKLLPASCRPNRGPASAPNFLLNHWIDTSPAPKPSNARIVNARDVLLERIRTCERIRAIDANLISVDFYRQGDLFGVVRQLNESSEE